MNKNLSISKNIDTLTRKLIEQLHTYYIEAVNDHGSFHIALSGGSTPKHIYEVLSENRYSDLFDWNLCHFYFGDERCVAPDNEDSNFNMANSALIKHIDIPTNNIHRIEAELDDHNEAACRYEKTLTSTLPKYNNKPHFDVVLLGLGPDGHIASLFPDTDALMVNDRLTTAVYVKKLDSWRITITYPIITSATHIFMIVPGLAKADILHSIFNTPPSHRPHYPVNAIKNLKQVEWFLDTDSASKLNNISQAI